MPTYEYICAKCKHTFETMQSIKAKALTVCPKNLCPKKPWGKGKVKRAIGTGGGLLFKGSGFYITDYRSDKYKAAAKKDAAPLRIFFRQRQSCCFDEFNPGGHACRRASADSQTCAKKGLSRPLL